MSSRGANREYAPNTPMMMTGRLCTGDRIGASCHLVGSHGPAVMVGCSRPLRARSLINQHTATAHEEP
jgi:hypothetical protein